MPGLFRVKTYVETLESGGPRTPIETEVTLSYDEGGAYTYELPTGTTDQSLILIGAAGGVETIQDFFVMADQNISLKIGTAGANVAFTVAANRPVLVTGTSITALSASNASGNLARVKVVLVGT